MDEYISRHEAIRAAQLAYGDYEATRKALYEIPAADVASVRRGHWIEEDGCQICSECGEEHVWDEYRAAYCDVCGARMDGAE